MSLAPVINYSKTKYDILKPLIQENFPSDTDEVCVYINMESILKRFYSSYVKDSMGVIDEEEQFLLSSELINVAAHYRHYFYSRWKVSTTFFIYYSTERASYNTGLFSNYKKDRYEKEENNLEYGSINRMVAENIKLIEVLTEYLPNIYFINTKDLAPSVLPRNMIKMNQGKGVTHIVLSNDEADYQLVTQDRTFLLTMRSDNTKAVTKQSLMQSLLKGSKKKKETSLSPDLYVPLLAITGFKDYNIDGIKGMGKIKAINFLEKALLDGKISNSKYVNIKPFVEELFDNEEDRELVERNFNLLSYDYLAKRMGVKQRDNIEDQLENKSDNYSLMEINAEYYERYPIMLLELCEGE